MADLSQLSGTRKLLAGVMTGLGVLALGVSLYLTWVTWQQSTVVGCTGGSHVDCDEVLSSTGSKWLGLPVSLLGALTYAGILAMIWPAVLVGGWAMTALLTLAMLGAGAGIWFIGTQAFVVQHFCLYCLVVHACGLLICTAAVFLMRSSAEEANNDHMYGYFSGQGVVESGGTNPIYQPLIAAILASVGLLALIGGQVFFAPASMEIVENIPIQTPANLDQESAETAESEQPSDLATSAEPPGDPVVATDQEAESASPDDAEPGQLEIVDGNAAEEQTSGGFDDGLFSENSGDAPRFFRFKYLAREIDAAGNPVVGNPYAGVRFVEMMDYTCPHCRKLHPFIKASVERYGDQLGFVIYHVPLSRKCNRLVKVEQSSHRNACEYAKLAYGVWKLAPEKFADYHEWLLEGERPPAIYTAKKKAMELVGEAILLDKSIAMESSRRVGENASELEPLKVGLPVLIFEEGVVRGMPESEQEWFQILEERMGLKPVGSVSN